MNFLKLTVDKILESLWFIPLAMTLCGLLLSIGVHELDWILHVKSTPFLGKEWGVDVEAVKYLFSNIGGAIITALTTILSITLLIFTVLSGQFGAHILRAFKIQTFSKFVIGWFSATYIYTMYNIYKITTSQLDYVPQLAILIGILLTLGTIFLLIFYIHFLVGQIQVERIISEISEELNQSINYLSEYKTDEFQYKKTKTPETKKNELSLDRSGYIQSINKNLILELATENNIFIKIIYRPGEFVISGSSILFLYTENEIDEKTIKKIKSSFVLGENRIPIEDVECNLELLVEMALRALSPGINDIIVANNCIDYIGDSISLLATKSFPSENFYNENGDLIMTVKEFSFEGYLNAALNPIRQYAINHLSVAIRLLDILIKVSLNVQMKKHKNIIQKHFDVIAKGIKNKYTEEMDLISLNKRQDLFSSLWGYTQ